MNKRNALKERQCREFPQELIALADRAARLGLHATATSMRTHPMQVVGWELAGDLAGMQKYLAARNHAPKRRAKRVQP